MKNFSDINENNNQKNIFSIEDEIQKLIDENLSIEIEGEDKPWKKAFKIKAEEKFYEKIQNIINKKFYKEKIDLLKEAKKSFFTKDYRWIDDEVDKMNKSLNGNN